MSKIYKFTSLTGPDETCLDNLDGALLNNGDIAIVTVSGVIYFYVLDHDNTSAESSPGIIQPNKNYGTKRWVLQGVGAKSTGWNFYIGGATNAHLITRHIDGKETTTEVEDTLYINYGIAGKGVQIGDTGTDHPLNVFGDIWAGNNISGLSFTDRTKYPETLQQAYDALASMTGKDGQVDHGKMDPFIQGKEPNTRDLGAVVSCQAAVINDLIVRLEKLEKK